MIFVQRLTIELRRRRRLAGGQIISCSHYFPGLLRGSESIAARIALKSAVRAARDSFVKSATGQALLIATTNRRAGSM